MIDVLYGFLIGLAYPPALVIVLALLRSAGWSAGILLGIAGLAIGVGPVVWVTIFVTLGFGAGVAAFAGWVLGLGAAAIMTILLLAAKIGSRSRGPRSAVGI